MIGTYKSIFGGAWFMSRDMVSAYQPYVYSLLTNSPLNLEHHKIPTEIINFSSVTHFNPSNVGSLSRIYINENEFVGVVKVHGAMTKNDVFCGGRGTGTIALQIDKWSDNPNCVGLLQDHDSGGGEASGTRRMARSIKNFSKPSSTYQRGDMASASAFTGCSSDKVYVDQDAGVSGSIGVIATYMDIMPALEKMGVKQHIVLAEGSEDKVKTHLDMLKGDYTLLKKDLKTMRLQFREWMLDVRPELNEKALTGKVYSPEKSIEVGLADEIGTFDDAFNYILEQHNLSTNSNNNTNMSTENKTYPNMQKALGMDTPLTVSKGFFASKGKVELSETQIDSIEMALNGVEGSTALKADNAALKTQLETAKGTNTSMDADISAAMVDLGLDATGDSKKDLATIVATTKEYGSQPGETNTQPQASQDGTGGESKFGYLDLEADMYNELN
ncbi:MAG: S49 family peptidase [Flavobacteriales bacterium]